MITIKVHYEVGEYEDTFVVNGETNEELREKADAFFKARGLEPDKCNAWSEDI